MFFRKNFLCALVCGALVFVSGASVASVASVASASAAAAGAEPLPLSLQQAQFSALEHNPDLHLSRLALNSAGAGVVIAGAAPNPVLTVQTFNINPALGIGAGALRSKAVDSTVRLDQLIERGGKRGFRLDSARNLEQAASGDVRDARRQLRLMVSSAYYDLLAAQDKLAITRQSAELFDSTLHAAQTRQQAGDLPSADVARAQVDALRARNDISQAESDLFTLRQNLALLMGRDGDAAALAPSDSWPAGAPPAAASFERVEALLRLRPDVLAAQARLDAAAASYKLALASRSADVTVGIQAEHYPSTATNAQGSGNSYGIALQIPLFVRYAYQGEIRTADIARESARETLDKVRAQARSELLVSAMQARAAYERVRRDDDELLLAAKKAADAAEFAFRHGALGIMDVLDVRRTYRSAQLEALAAHADYAKSLAASQAATSEGQQ